MDSAWRLWKSRRTVMEMLRDRGYEIPAGELTLGTTEFKRKYCVDEQMDDTGVSDAELAIDREKISFDSRHRISGAKVFVTFYGETTIAVAEVKEVYNRFRTSGIRHAILIVRRPPSKSVKMTVTSRGRRAISALKSHGFRVEYFLEQEVIVNISQHHLVPRHIVMSEDDKIALLKKYRISLTQLPRIRANDPMARYHGVERGQVMQIVRNSSTSGKYVTYRVVI